MPVYEYLCSECGVRFEVRQTFDSEPSRPCQSCGKAACRLFHPTTVIYKGSGFYTTDYHNADKNSSPD